MGNYLPIHDELCVTTGLLLEEYVHGNDKSKGLVKIEKYEAGFFILIKKY